MNQRQPSTKLRPVTVWRNWLHQLRKPEEQLARRRVDPEARGPPPGAGQPSAPLPPAPVPALSAEEGQPAAQLGRKWLSTHHGLAQRRERSVGAHAREVSHLPAPEPFGMSKRLGWERWPVQKGHVGLVGSQELEPRACRDPLRKHPEWEGS